MMFAVVFWPGTFSESCTRQRWTSVFCDTPIGQTRPNWPCALEWSLATRVGAHSNFSDLRESVAAPQLFFASPFYDWWTRLLGDKHSQSWSSSSCASIVVCGQWSTLLSLFCGACSGRAFGQQTGMFVDKRGGEEVNENIDWVEQACFCFAIVFGLSIRGLLMSNVRYSFLVMFCHFPFLSL